MAQPLDIMAQPLDIISVSLDFNKKYLNEIPSVQGDTGRAIEFIIVENNKPVDLTGESVKIFGIKPDDNRIFNNATITDPTAGKCLVELTPQMLAVTGTVYCNLARYKDGKRISSMKFEIFVNENVSDELDIESTSEYLTLTDILSGGAGNITIDTSNLATKSELNNKVDKIEGKGLSTEDFTTELKTKLESLEDNSANSNPYKGKKWTALGDSLTMTTSSNSIKHTPNGRNYTYWVKEKLGIGTLVNMGLDSSTISTVRTSPQNFVQRMVNIPSDTDLITVFGGYNDMWSNSSKLGTIEDIDTNTIYGALNKIARYLLCTYPKATIVFFTMLHWTWEREGSSANAPFVVNPNGLTTPLLNQAIRDVGNKYSIPVIDLEKNSGIFPGTFNQKTGVATKYPHFSYYTYDGLHLNERGHQKISNVIVSELLKLNVGYTVEDATVATISDPSETGTATAIAWATKYTSSTGGSNTGGNTGEGGGGTTPNPEEPTNYVDVPVSEASSRFTYANDNKSSVTNWTMGCACSYPKSQTTLGITISTDASVVGDFTLVGTNVEGITVTSSNILGGNKSGEQELVAVQGTAEGGFYLAFRLSHTRLGINDSETNTTVMLTKFKEYLAACDWVLRFNK